MADACIRFIGYCSEGALVRVERNHVAKVVEINDHLLELLTVTGILAHLFLCQRQREGVVAVFHAPLQIKGKGIGLADLKADTAIGAPGVAAEHEQVLRGSQVEPPILQRCLAAVIGRFLVFLCTARIQFLGKIIFQKHLIHSVGRTNYPIVVVHRGLVVF